MSYGVEDITAVRRWQPGVRNHCTWPRHMALRSSLSRGCQQKKC